MKLAVVGSINIDQTVIADRIPHKGETLPGHGLSYIPGGKGANQAVAMARLGADVTMFGCVGDDDNGQKMIDNLRANGVNADYVRTVKGVPTGIAIITLGDNDNTIIVIAGANSKVDRGGETYKGITHTTYDEYRKSKGLSTQSVTKMTDDEMQEIYYERFYKASGADKVTDKKLALYVFDTAVNMGVKVAKDFLDKCGGDRDKFEQLRKNRYKKIIENDKDQKAHEKGWNNRMIAIKDAADNQLNAIA